MREMCGVCAFAGVRDCDTHLMCVLVGRRVFAGVRAYRWVLCFCSEKSPGPTSCVADTLDMAVPGLVVGSKIHSVFCRIQPPAATARIAPVDGC